MFREKHAAEKIPTRPPVRRCVRKENQTLARTGQSERVEPAKRSAILCANHPGADGSRRRVRGVRRRYAVIQTARSVEPRTVYYASYCT